MNRWAVFLDVEGVTKIYPSNESRFFQAFDAMLEALCSIGTKAYPETPVRLFAHQVGGDGLVVVSEFSEGRPEVPISLAVLLMQVLLANGAVAKVGISEGDFADVTGCFPSIRAFPSAGDRTVQLGGGLLTLFPVMGTALINSHHFATVQPRGTRLVVDTALMERVPEGVMVAKHDDELYVIDWIHTATPTMEQLRAKTGLGVLPINVLEWLLVRYVRGTGALAQSEWGRNSLRLNGCENIEVPIEC
jgi:hypothetical protein